MINWFHTKAEVAEYIGISRQYLHRLEKHAKLPGRGYRQLGRISSKEVEEWVKENFTISTDASQKYFHPKQDIDKQ